MSESELTRIYGIYRIKKRDKNIVVVVGATLVVAPALMGGFVKMRNSIVKDNNNK